MNWINTKEKLPELDKEGWSKRKLVVSSKFGTKYPFIEIAYYFDKEKELPADSTHNPKWSGWYKIEGDEDVPVDPDGYYVITHWSDLPELPEQYLEKT